MSVFVFALNAIFPILFFIILGYVLKKRIFSSEERIAGLSKLCAEILLPCTLFYPTATTNFSDSTSRNLTLFCSIFTLTAIALLCILIPRFIKNKASAKSIIQGGFRGNLMVISLTLLTTMYGDVGTRTASVAVAVNVAIYNIMAVIVLSDFSGKFSAARLFQIIYQVLRSPLLIGAVFGILFSLLGIRLPPTLDSIVSKLAVCGSCLSMVVLGANFTVRHAIQKLRLSSIAVAIKVMLLPAVSVICAYALGFRGIELSCVFAIMGAPTSTNSAVIATSLGCDGALSGEIVVLSTFAYVVTSFSGIVILRSFGLI